MQKTRIERNKDTVKVKEKYKVLKKGQEYRCRRQELQKMKKKLKKSTKIKEQKKGMSGS